MHPQFISTVEQIAAWAREDSGIAGVVIIGSQARTAPPPDQWSDLDLMVLVEDPQRLLTDAGWLDRFGLVACFFKEVVPLHGFDWAWHVKRVLYEDNRDIDFSILPYEYVDEVLLVNKEILSKGFQVMYDRSSQSLDQKINALLEGIEEKARIPTEAELRNVVSDLLFHIIWAFKKIKRNELWVAVSCINSYMKNHLLWLIEARHASIAQANPTLAYNGRFLEQWAGPEITEELKGCFTHYDVVDAVNTLDHLLEVICFLSRSICEQNGYVFDAALFERITKLYNAMKEHELDEHA